VKRIDIDGFAIGWAAFWLLLAAIALVAVLEG
jgi:hypothetical protein